jgi:type IV pilus assembly protein PilE
MGFMQTTRCLPGFTLVELMIVLVIASILGAILYPSYRDHLIRAALPEATGSLSLYAARLEEHYLDYRSYADSSGGCALPVQNAGKFSFSCRPGSDGQSYQLTATGVSGDLASFSYTLDQNGNERTTGLPSGWGTVPADCWIQKRQASC